MQYKISVETDYTEAEYFFDSLADAKSQYTIVLTFYMFKGRRFSIAMFSGIADHDGNFWHHSCIATFDYDGDDSVLEADK